MLFPTIEFLLFFDLVFPLTWLLNHHNRSKKAFLALVSLVFYAAWDVRFVFLLLGSAAGNFLFGLGIGRAQSDTTRARLTALAVAANLLPLAFFKYYDFGVAQLQTMFDLFGLRANLGSTGLAVPVAISFLTFHGISYVVDVKRGRTAPTKSFVDLLLYVSFFPHLVAGPIVRAADFLGQLQHPSRSTDIALGKSAVLILGGLFKKVVVASHLSTLFVDPVFTNPAGHSSLDLLLAIYAYAIVIYCDFSAYTDIAIGVADLLGYKFPQNFDQPYRSASVQDFWRRWHMSLSSWLRDYLYVPLGGNRHGRARTYVNLLLTMLLGGLWHGAGLQFVFWGFLHGAALAIERFAGETIGKDNAFWKPWASRPALILRGFLVFNFVCFTWIFFRSPDFATAREYIVAMVSGSAGTGMTITPFVAILMVIGIVPQYVPPTWRDRVAAGFDAVPLPGKLAAAVAVLWAVVILAPDGVAPFIYFQF